MKSSKKENILRFSRKSKVVIWEDAVVLNNESIADLSTRPPELVETYGKVCKTDKYVYIKTHDSKEDGSDDFTRVPIGMLKKIRRV